MKEFQEYQRQLTYKGAVVIPVEIRRLLGVKPRDRVTFRVVKGRKVELIPTMTLEETFASVRPKTRPLDFKQLRESAIGEKARKTLDKMKD